MMDVAVAVVDADSPGNIGTVARAMKNFGLADLYLVDPPPLDPDGEAYGFAGSAREDVLPAARTVSFEFLIENFYTVGTTATTNEDARSHVRYPYFTPDALVENLRDVGGEAVLVFGRERIGLTNEELARLDAVCSIPASAEYPVLNLGQAATVVCYELGRQALTETQHPSTIDRADEETIEALYDQFGEFLNAVRHPAEKRPKARRLFRRLVGRAHPTDREARTLRGLLRRGSDCADPRE